MVVHMRVTEKEGCLIITAGNKMFRSNIDKKGILFL